MEATPPTTPPTLIPVAPPILEPVVQPMLQPITPPVASPVSLYAGAPDPSDTSNSKVGMIVGITVGGVAAIALSAFIIYSKVNSLLCFANSPGNYDAGNYGVEPAGLAYDYQAAPLV